jgi:hypothetical protein
MSIETKRAAMLLHYISQHTGRTRAEITAALSRAGHPKVRAGIEHLLDTGFLAYIHQGLGTVRLTEDGQKFLELAERLSRTKETSRTRA